MEFVTAIKALIAHAACQALLVVRSGIPTVLFVTAESKLCQQAALPQHELACQSTLSRCNKPAARPWQQIEAYLASAPAQICIDHAIK